MNERRSLQLLAEKYEQVLEGKKGVRISDDIRNQIISTYEKGLAGNTEEGSTNLKEIARRSNVHYNTVVYILKQSGIPGSGLGRTQIGKNVVPINQKIPPDQIKYIDNLIAQKDDQGVFQYSQKIIVKMVNEYTDAHPELNWYKVESFQAIQNYITRWEEENIPGETRMDYGVRGSNGGIWRRKPNLPDHKGTRQTSSDPLGPPPTATGRAQDIDDQAYQVKGSPTVTPPV